MREKLEAIKKVIDAQAYTGGLLDRAENAAVSLDDDVVKNVKVTTRCKKKSHKVKRG